MQVTFKVTPTSFVALPQPPAQGDTGGWREEACRSFWVCEERCGGVGGIVTNYHNLRDLRQHVFTILRIQRSRVQRES